MPRRSIDRFSLFTLLLAAWPAPIFGGAGALASATLTLGTATVVLAAPNDTTDLAGLTFKDDDIYAAIAEFDEGNTAGAIDRLTKLIGDKAAGDNQRRAELGAAVAMLQVRTGAQPDLLKAKDRLNSLARLHGATDLARRAQVLKLIADNKVKDGTSGVRDLKPREHWLEHLRQARRHLENRMNEEDDKMAKAVGRRDWGTIREGLMLTTDFVEQMEVIHLDPADSREAIGVHAEHLSALARDLSETVDHALEKVETLKAAGRIDANGKKRGKGGGGYKKAGEINEQLRLARTASEWAKAVEKNYQSLRTGRNDLFPPLRLRVKSVPSADVE